MRFWSSRPKKCKNLPNKILLLATTPGKKEHPFELNVELNKLYRKPDKKGGKKEKKENNWPEQLQTLSV